MKPPNRTAVLVLIAVIVYGISIAANTVCMATGVYDWRAGQSVFSAMNFITFVMAFVALFGRATKPSDCNCHAGDCTIYASIANGSPSDGVCTCGYGLGLVRKGDYSQMYSKELKERNL